MDVRYIKVTFEGDEFEKAFPDIARRSLNASDKVRVALGFAPRNTKGGAPLGNTNALGHKRRGGRKQKRSD